MHFIIILIIIIIIIIIHAYERHRRVSLRSANNQRFSNLEPTVYI